MTGQGISLLRKWRKQFSFSFNTLVVGAAFDSTNHIMMLGTTDGKIRIINGEKEEQPLETKGGSIQTMLLHNVTNFGGKDLVIGDSDGNVVIFTNGEILSHIQIGSPVNSLCCIDLSTLNLSRLNSAIASEIIVGDRSGSLTALSIPSDIKWKIRTKDTLTQLVNTSSYSGTLFSVDPTIRCVCPASLLDKFGLPMYVLLVSDGTEYLHFFAQSNRIHSLPIPSRINCICTGFFKMPNIKSEDNFIRATKQILVGCGNGSIYLIEDFTVSLYADIGMPITHLLALPSKNLQKTTEDNDGNSGSQIQNVLCGGHFNSVKLFSNGQLIFNQSISDWVNTLALTSDDEKEVEIIIGMVDNSVDSYQLHTH